MRKDCDQGAPRLSVVLCAMTVILLLAAGVCALHRYNALTPRGTAQASDYVITDGAAQGLLPALDTPQDVDGVLCISGALLRLDQPVGAVNVTVGLIARPVDEEAGEVILLPTQLVRMPELAQEYGCDDHCGFRSTVRRALLANGRYDVVLLDEANGERRMVQTALAVELSDSGMAVGEGHAPQEAAYET